MSNHHSSEILWKFIYYILSRCPVAAGNTKVGQRDEGMNEHPISYVYNVYTTHFINLGVWEKNNKGQCIGRLRILI